MTYVNLRGVLKERLSISKERKGGNFANHIKLRKWLMFSTNYASIKDVKLEVRLIVNFVKLIYIRM